MTLFVWDHGVATAYATVSVGHVQSEIDDARAAVHRLKQDKPRRGEPLSEPEIIFLLGQADVATLIDTSDFRPIFDLRYPRASNAHAVNWVFSILYSKGTPERPPTPPSPFRFILHLRLNRQVYAYPGIEEKIVDKLIELLEVHNKHVRIHASLGWSDLVLDGFFEPETFERLIEFVIHVHGLRIKAGNKTVRVLQRMLTVLGYTGEAPELPNRAHSTFLRVMPGAYDEVAELLQNYGAVYILDGKADFMVISEGDMPPDWLARQRTLGGREYAKLLRKVETHLMYFSAERFNNRDAAGRLTIDGGADQRHREACDCNPEGGEVVRDIEQMISSLSRQGLLPAEQRYAVDNILFLLASTMREPSICCDVRDAVAACNGGLLGILRAIRDKGAEVPETSVSAKHAELVRLWSSLDDWHRFTEMLLRQRTVGSYEEILGQTDRAVVYSGGVQQFLYLADQLIKHFAERVEPTDTPVFTTMYDSVKTILSYDTGILRVPTTKIFSLPLVVADLWHEVGVRLFMTRLAQKVAEYAQAPSADDTAMVFPSDSPRAEDVAEFINLASDHYADIIVYLYGFAGDFDRFVASLAHGWQETYRDFSYVLYAHHVAQFLSRIYLIYEFHELRRALRPIDSERLTQFFNPEITAPRLVDEMNAYVTERLTRRYSTVSFAAADWDLLKLNVITADFSNLQRSLYHPFVDTNVERSEPRLSAFEAGEVIRFESSDDLNAYFAEMAYWIQSADRSADIPYFRMMGALGKSAAIEFHRRQMR